MLCKSADQKARKRPSVTQCIYPWPLGIAGPQSRPIFFGIPSLPAFIIPVLVAIHVFNRPGWREEAASIAPGARFLAHIDLKFALNMSQFRLKPASVIMSSISLPTAG